MRSVSMLEHEDPLPRAQGQAAVDNGNGKLDLGEGGANMGRHVIRAFDDVPVVAVSLGHESAEKLIQIAEHGRIRVFLNQ